MSAWYVFNALGFYPMNPASGEYMIGSPIFDAVVINFPKSTSGSIKIIAENSRREIYVKSLKIDGQEIDSPVLTHSTLMTSRELEFEMSARPQKWASNANFNQN
jgi:putative alpha-1,2-mannosidase